MKYRVEFKKLFCCAIGLLGSYLAHGADFLQTKHGVLSIAGDFQQNKLVLNGKTLSLPGGDADYASLEIIEKYIVNDGEVILISDSPSAVCVLYRFVVLNKTHPIITPAFGTCDDNPRVSQNGDQISLKMRNKKSKTETFIYSNGIVKKMEKN